METLHRSAYEIIYLKVIEANTLILDITIDNTISTSK